MAFPTATLLPDSVDPAQVFIKAFSYEAPQQDFVVPLTGMGGGASAGGLPATGLSSGSYLTGFNAGATIAAWQVVVLGASSTFLLADANGAGLQCAIGVAVEAGSVALGELKVLRRGLATLAAWTWTPGLPVYHSGATPGLLTQTAPSTSGDFVQVVGIALNADTIMFDFAGTPRLVP